MATLSSTTPSPSPPCAPKLLHAEPPLAPGRAREATPLRFPITGPTRDLTSSSLQATITRAPPPKPSTFDPRRTATGGGAVCPPFTLLSGTAGPCTPPPSLLRPATQVPLASEPAHHKTHSRPSYLVDITPSSIFPTTATDSGAHSNRPMLRSSGAPTPGAHRSANRHRPTELGPAASPRQPTTPPHHAKFSHSGHSASIPPHLESRHTRSTHADAPPRLPPQTALPQSTDPTLPSSPPSVLTPALSAICAANRTRASLASGATPYDQSPPPSPVRARPCTPPQAPSPFAIADDYLPAPRPCTPRIPIADCHSHHPPSRVGIGGGRRVYSTVVVLLL